MDYQQIELDLICGILDALPHPTVLLNRDGQAAYINASGEECGLAGVSFEDNEAVVATLAYGVRHNGELVNLGNNTGVARIYPVYQAENIIGALYCFEPVAAEDGEYPSELPYASSAIQDVTARIAGMSGINAAVLFVGETGVGKESFARKMYSLSRNDGRSFIAVDCRPGSGGLTALLENESRCRECAEAGILYFDGIESLRANEQTEMINIIRNKQLNGFTLAGRLCFSTVPELQVMARNGEFSSELVSRISLMNVVIPPLRDRQDDIPPLARYFLAKHAKLYSKSITDFSEEVWRYMLKHDWPQNLRDMETIIKESVADCAGSIVTEIPLAASRQVSLRRERHKFTYTRIEALLSVYGNTTEGKRRAAKELGIGLSSLYRIIANYQRDKKWGRVD